MKIIFKKEKQHVCHICDLQFDWGNNSWTFGKREYRTITEKKKDLKYFCSTKCMKQFKK